MSNPFEPPDGPPPEKGGGVPNGSGSGSGSGANPFEPPESPPPEKGGTSNQAFAFPPGIPPNRPGGSGSTSDKAVPAPSPAPTPATAAGSDPMNVAIPDEPPPAYSSTPSAATGEQSMQAGPNRMDFSGPPPIPDRFNYDRPQIEQQITGVGYGYRPEPSSGGGGGYAPPPMAPPGKAGDTKSSSSGDPYNDKQSLNPQYTGTSAGPSRPPAPDLSPTEVATPGRPLLRKGQLLVYPKNHYCNKCFNTGYKNNDPSNPHDADWRKYGKPYNSALQASYKGSVGPHANPSTQASSNFQRPLPDFSRPPQGPPPSSRPNGPGGSGNGGGWNHYAGNFAPSPSRPPPPGPPGGWGPPQQQWGPPPSQIYHMGMGGMMPPGLVVKPGDPRLGGIPCWRCGGEGRELSFFGFDDGKCRECRGIGRLFPYGR